METGRYFGRLLARRTPETMTAGPPVFDDFQGPAEFFLEPKFQALVVGIGPDQGDSGNQDLKIGEKKHASHLIVDVGRVDLGLDDGALRIDEDLPLST